MIRRGWLCLRQRLIRSTKSKLPEIKRAITFIYLSLVIPASFLQLIIEIKFCKLQHCNQFWDFLVLIANFSSCRLGIKREDLPKLEEQLELKIAKAQLEELKKDAVEAMETQKKRYISRIFVCKTTP